MSKLVFCDEGQSTASIIINGIEYTTTNPPLTVEYTEVYYETRYGAQFVDSINWSLAYRYNEGRVKGYLIGNNIQFMYYPPGVIQDIENGILVKSVSRNAAYNSGLFTFYDGLLQAKDRVNQILYEKKGIAPDYKIQCDGCRPGECKGKQSKYPGYVCLDCKRMKQSIDNSIARLK